MRNIATALMCLITIVAGFALGVVLQYFITLPKDSDPLPLGDLSIHFMELGNDYAGDSIYIKAGDTDIIVDGGSRPSSVTTTSEYINEYVTDGIIEYAIITHGDQDHIATFAGDNTYDSMFDLYEFKTIIDFPKTNKDTQVINRYFAERDAEIALGATHYNALQCYNNTDGASRVIELSDGITLEFLYNYYYDHHSGDENNYSVCFQIVNGDQKYLFTGDLEKEGEAKLLEHNTLSEVVLFKAGHHGSKTSSNSNLLAIIKPKVCVVSCVAGSVEYTQNLENVFPTQAFCDRISAYDCKVYVTSQTTIKQVDDGEGGLEWVNDTLSSMNGNIVFKVNKGAYSVQCSASDTELKDSAWYQQYRVA